jgi:hypothetical protein
MDGEQDDELVTAATADQHLAAITRSFVAAA